MKRAKNVILLLALLCGTVLFSGMKAESAASKRVVYIFYDAGTDIYIDYNPGNGAVSGVHYGPDGIYYADCFDSFGDGLSYDHTTQILTAVNYHYVIGGVPMTETGSLVRIF